MARWAWLIAGVSVNAIAVGLVAACSLDLQPYVDPVDGGPRIGETNPPRDGGDQTSDSDRDGAEPPGTDPTRPPKLVFVTSGQYVGSFGGVAAANAKCNQLATAANLTGQYIAWLSVENDLILPRLVSDGPWHLAGKEPAQQRLVFPNKAAILTMGPAVPINRTEMGTAVKGKVWTGTNAKGELTVRNTCSGFTKTEIFTNGGTGDSEAKTAEWTFVDDENSACSSGNRLYCFEL